MEPFNQTLITNPRVYDSATGNVLLEAANNLSDVTDAAGARTNLDVYSTGEVDEYLAPKATAGGVRFDGSSGTAVITDGGDFGIENQDKTFSLYFKSSDTSSTGYVISKGAYSPGGFGIQKRSSTGYLRIYALQDGLASVHSAYELQENVCDGKWHHIVLVVDGTTGANPAFTLYVDNTVKSLSTLTSPTGTYGDSTQSFSVAARREGIDLFSDMEAKDLSIFNRALTASEVADLYRNGLAGIADADRWGSTVISPTVRNGGFETAGAGGADVFADWNEYTFGTSTISQETVDVNSGSGALKIVTDGSNSNALVGQSGLIEIGATYRVSFWGKGGGTAATEIAGIFLGGTSAAIAAYTLTTSWAYYEREVVATTTELNVGRFFSGGAGQTILIDDLKIEKVGAIAAYPMDEGIGYQLHDISSNHYDGLLSTSGFTHLVPKTEGYIRDFGVDAYNGGSGNTELVNGTRRIIPEKSHVIQTILFNAGSATVGDLILRSTTGGGNQSDIGSYTASGVYDLSAGGTVDFLCRIREQNHTISRNLAVSSTDADATNLNIRVDYKVIE